MTILLRAVLILALAVWAIFTLFEFVLVWRDERRARLLDRHITEALMNVGEDR